MWKKSLLLLFVELLSFASSFLRKRFTSRAPVTTAHRPDPKVSDSKIE